MPDDIWAEHTIVLEGSSQKTPKAKCSCGWEFGPSTKILDLGLAAQSHALSTGHRLRQHSFGMNEAAG